MFFIVYLLPTTFLLRKVFAIRVWKYFFKKSGGWLIAWWCFLILTKILELETQNRYQIYRIVSSNCQSNSIFLQKFYRSNVQNRFQSKDFGLRSVIEIVGKTITLKPLHVYVGLFTYEETNLTCVATSVRYTFVCTKWNQNFQVKLNPECVSNFAFAVVLVIMVHSGGGGIIANATCIHDVLCEYIIFY